MAIDETAPPEPAPEQTAAFDAKAYDDPELALYAPTGHAISRIRVAAAGAVELDRMDPDAVSSARDLQLGRLVRLTVYGHVSRVTYGHKATDGERATLAIRISAEELGTIEIVDS